MNRPRQPRRSLVTVATVTALLAGCASTPPDPRVLALTGQLAAIKADTTVAQTAPAELAAAETALAEARRTSGDPVHRRRLLQIAELRLRIARATAEAVIEERRYQRLQANTATLHSEPAPASPHSTPSPP